MSEPRPVVAAIDGSSGGKAALRYAVDRAEALGRPLVLVHVAPTFPPTAGFGALGVPYIPEQFMDTGRDILDEALQAARALLPQGDVSGRLLTGLPIAGLIGSAEQAHEIVLGADHMPLIARIAIGSAVSGVASGSHAPVVVVPDYWSSSVPTDPRIVVAIQTYEHVPPHLLRASFELAREHQTRLEFVHVWDLPSKYAEIVDSLTDYSAWQSAVRHMIERAVGDLEMEFADVPYSVTALHGQPVPILRDASAKARLLVIAREAHHLPRLGHVGRTLLRVSACPVQMIPLQVSQTAAEESAVGAHLDEPRSDLLSNHG